VLEYLSLDITVPQNSQFSMNYALEKKCSTLGTDNAGRRISNNIFGPNGGYCLGSIYFNAYLVQTRTWKII